VWLCVSDFVLVTVNRVVYLMGGCDMEQPVQSDMCQEVTNHFSSYDVAANQWTVLPGAPNNRTRYNVAVSAAGDKIVYVGGRAYSDAIITDVDVWDIPSATWSTITPAGNLHWTSDGAAWQMNNHIYVTGGYDANYTSYGSTVYADIGNLAAGFSSGAVADMPFTNGDIGLVGPLDNKIYVIGGFESPDFCHPLANLTSYDIASNTWTELPSMQHARGDMGYTSVGSTIYAAGGETKTSACTQSFASKSVPVNEVEAFDLTNPSAGWSELADLAVTHMRFMAASDNTTNSIFTFGGQGAQSGVSAADFNDPASLTGYYPILSDVYSLSLTQSSTIVNAAPATVASSLAVIVALVAAIILA